MHADLEKVCTFATREPAKPLYNAYIGGSFYFMAQYTVLFLDNPTIDANAMGIPMGWEQEPLWQ